MPTLKAPLAGSLNTRGDAGANNKDQRFVACTYQSVVNPASNTKTVYLEKRGGLQSLETISANVGYGVFYSPFNRSIYTAFASPSTIYVLTLVGGTPSISCGAMTGKALHFYEVVLGGVGYVLITSADSTGWYIASDSIAQTAYTCTTHTSTLVDGIPSTAGMYAGQAFTGSGVQAGTRIASVNSAVAITLTLATTTSTTGTFTKTPIAKIIDVDFPTDITGSFVELDGTIYIGTISAKIYGSDLNSVSSWSASNFITANIYSGIGVGCAKYKNQIGLFKTDSVEWFYNAGNAAGSLLSSSPTLAASVGCAYTAGNVGKALIGFGYDMLAWMTGQNELYIMNGFTPTLISYVGVDGFASLGGTLDVINIGNHVGGQIVIHGSTSTIGKWYIPSEKAFVTHGYSDTCYISHTSAVLGNAIGKLYSVGLSGVYQDNGSAYTMSVQIQTDMGSQKRKFATELRLIGDVQASGSLAVSYSDDDGATFSVARNMPLTSIATMKLTRLGSWKGSRLWKFEHSANTPFRAKMIEIDYDIAA